MSEIQFIMSKELKVFHSPGEILRTGKYNYVDQLSEIHKEFSSNGSSGSKYLEQNYGLTTSEYYSLIVYNNKDYIPKCEYCKKPITKFKSLSKGWTRYCSQSCITSHRLTKESELGINPFQNKKFIESNRIRVSKFQKDRMKSGTSHLLEKRCELTASKMFFINMCKSKGINNAYLYICSADKYPEFYKIGISSISPYCRYKYKNGCKLYNHHKLLSGTPEEIASIEYMIKSELSEGSTELISKNDIKELFNIIRNYKQSMLI